MDRSIEEKHKDKVEALAKQFPEWVNLSKGVSEAYINLDYEQNNLFLRKLDEAIANKISGIQLFNQLRVSSEFLIIPDAILFFLCSYENKPWYLKHLKKSRDAVNSPAHYQIAGMEVIDLIREATKDLSGPEGYELGNALKYLFRYQHKGNALQDLQKARKHINWLIDRYESEGDGDA